MSGMFRKVNAREIIVGWYSTGPKLKKSDIEIHEVFRQYIPHPVYVIINVKPKDVGIPIESYAAVEEAQDEKSQPKLTFAHVPSEVGALEAEEIGVEHLLRDVKDTTVSDLATSVQSRMNAMQALKSRLEEIYQYLEMVIDKKLPINHNILYILQDVFNLLPGLQTEETKMGFTTQTNDSMLSMYISSTVRSIIALHELINNKLDLRKFELEEKSEKKKEEKKEEKTKEKQEENVEEKKDVKKQSTD
jgi:26S proteasome regulatory subunit N8